MHEVAFDANKDWTQIEAREHLPVCVRNIGARYRTATGDDSADQAGRFLKTFNRNLLGLIEQAIHSCNFVPLPFIWGTISESAHVG